MEVTSLRTDHGGTLTSPNGGSRRHIFWGSRANCVRFILTRIHEDSIMNAQADAAEAGNPVVLIVNREPEVCTWLAALLSADGLSVKVCHSAGECRAHQTLTNLSCGILDVDLVDASGFALQESLARHGSPVIFVTRNGSVTACSRALKAGAVDFLSLPCGSQEILHAVRAAIKLGFRLRAEREQFNRLRGRFERLTQRERELFELVASGLLNKQVAQRLGISEVTVQIHRGRVMRKMAARSFAALVRMAHSLELPVVDAPRPIPRARLHASSDQSFASL